MSIQKAVIPAAGLGTRFLPATKAIPKEMLPIVDIPTIQYIVYEAVKSGIEDIIFVTGRGKDSILDHFDVSPELAEKLEKDGKKELLKVLEESASIAPHVISVRQKVARGLGDAVLCAKDLIGDEPFLVLLGDDMVDAEVPCAKQMIDVHKEHGKSVVALMEVSDDDVSKFGICGGKSVSERVMELDTMVEKPSLKEAPSHLAIVGRYVLNPSIFSYLEKGELGKGGELQLTDAMAAQMREEGFLGYEFTGDRYDAGDKFGFLQANIAYAMKRPDIAPKLREYMKELVEKG